MGFRARVVAGTAAMVALVCAAFVAGRLTTRQSTEHVDTGGPQYVAGFRAGEALGIEEGRALQEGAALPADSRRPASEAFTAGYSAGMNDVFTGYDGGWLLGVPYVITLAPGSGSVTYRIQSRSQMRGDVRYFLCKTGREICEQR